MHEVESQSPWGQELLLYHLFLSGVPTEGKIVSSSQVISHYVIKHSVFQLNSYNGATIHATFSSDDAQFSEDVK